MPALLAGLGIADLPDFIVGDAIASGEVEVILKGWKQSEGAVHLLTPPGGPRPARVEALADFLANKTPGLSTPQTRVTTHSPTLAASVPPNRVLVMFTDLVSNKPRCNSVGNAAMDDREFGQLQRMMDITRATLYFAKGVILVEGISEALLLPVLAKRLGYDLAKLHITVIPICGVAFTTFKKLLDPVVLGIPVAIVTDADPTVPTDTTWKDAMPEIANGSFKLCDRAEKLIGLFARHETVQVFHSKLTLEYDLAEAGDENASIMAIAWENCFTGSPGTFNKKIVDGSGSDRKAKALATWRGICRATHSGNKAEFAHQLAAMLIGADGSGECPLNFIVPEYLKEAIGYAVKNVIKSNGPLESNRA